MEGRVLKGKNATFEASSAFKNIATSTGESLRTAQDILTATEVQKSSISDVVKYVEEVVAIAEQTASGTQQVAGTAKQLSASMQELTASSQQLNDIAEDLQVGISAFKLINGNLLIQQKNGRRNPVMPVAQVRKQATAPKQPTAAEIRQSEDAKKAAANAAANRKPASKK
jgi:hypothetical protein